MPEEEKPETPKGKTPSEPSMGEPAAPSEAASVAGSTSTAGAVPSTPVSGDVVSEPHSASPGSREHGAESGAKTNLTDNGVPQGLVYLALLVGLVLTACGSYVTMQAVQYTTGVHFAALVACVGLGMVLVSVGGRAVGTWRSWSVAGAAAAAPLLFLLQWQLQPASPILPASGPQVVRGELSGTGKFQQVSIWTSNGPLYVRRHRVGHPFQFVALPEQIEDATSFSLNVVNEEGKDPRDFTVYCISGDMLRRGLQTEKPLMLTLRPVSGREGSSVLWFVYDQTNVKHGRYNDDDCSAPDDQRNIQPASLPGGWRFSAEDVELRLASWGPISLASAQTRETEPSVRDLLAALEAESSDSRTASRIELSRRNNSDSLAEIAGTWDVSESSYRKDLGLLAAWNRAIRSVDRATAVRLGQALSPLQITHVIGLTGHPDSTMRTHATNLVSWLIQATAWPQGIPIEVARGVMGSAFIALHSSEEFIIHLRDDIKFQPLNVVTNMLVAFDWAGCHATKVDRDKLIDVLSSLANGSLPPPEEHQGRALRLAALIKTKMLRCPV